MRSTKTTNNELLLATGWVGKITHNIKKKWLRCS